MARLLIVFIALFLPLQFAWSAASAYCQHESGEPQQSMHFGHHVHACKDDGSKGADGTQKAHADCGVCQAAGTPGIATQSDAIAFVAASALPLMVAPAPFSSALARAPDRPQWLRLV